jgi:hypothetical protein
MSATGYLKTITFASVNETEAPSRGGDFVPMLAGLKKLPVLVQPQTVIGRHWKGFSLYWRFLSHRKTFGPSKAGQEIRKLIHQMAQSNLLLGSPSDMWGDCQNLATRFLNEQFIA